MLFSSIYKTTGLLQRIPDDLIWQCGGCNNTLELSWQPSRALGLLPLPGRVSPATDSLNAPLYYNVSFLFTHRRLLVFYFLINIHPFEYKKNHPSVGRCGDFLVVSRRKMSPRARLSHRAHEPLPVMAQQHFTAQCSPLSFKHNISLWVLFDVAQLEMSRLYLTAILSSRRERRWFAYCPHR